MKSIVLLLCLVASVCGQPQFVTPDSPCFRVLSSNGDAFEVKVDAITLQVPAGNFVSTYRVIPTPAPLVLTVMNLDGTNTTTSFNITTNDYYTVGIPTGSGPIVLLKDAQTQTTLNTSRYRVLNLGQAAFNVSINGADLGSLEVSDVTNFIDVGIDGRIAGNLTQFVQVYRNGVQVAEKYTAFFLGRSYTVLIRRSPNPLQPTEVVIITDTELGAIVPKVPLINQTGLDLCQTFSLQCKPGFVCRNGRCLDAVKEKCRDYAGFDVVEVARDVLIYTDNQIIEGIKRTNTQLNRLILAAQNPLLLTNLTASLVPYHNGLIAFCGGRKCNATQCAAGGTCTRQECRYPGVDKCIGLRQVEFLQVAFLGAIAAFTSPPQATCLTQFVPL